MSRADSGARHATGVEVLSAVQALAGLDPGGRTRLVAPSPASDLTPGTTTRYKCGVLRLLHDGPSEGPRLLLAHGAGAPMDSPFMNAIAERIAARGICVARFEFEYMAKRRDDGARRPPDRSPRLIARFKEAIELWGPPGRLVIGGKSMGGRIASMIAEETTVAGVVCLGYPFHPPGKPQHLRIAHLESMQTPTLIVQGTRDPFGRPDEVGSYPLSSSIQIVWLPDGNHSFEPRKKSGRTSEQNLDQAAGAVTDFIRRHA